MNILLNVLDRPIVMDSANFKPDTRARNLNARSRKILIAGTAPDGVWFDAWSPFCVRAKEGRRRIKIFREDQMLEKRRNGPTVLRRAR